MKKTKKLSAMLLASVITAGTVSSLSAGALYTETSGIELYEGWSYCDDFAILHGGEYDKITVDSKGESYHGYKKIDDIIVFKPADGVSVSEINEVLSELNKNYRASSRSLLSDYNDFKCMIEAEGGISLADARNVINAVKDKGFIKDAFYLNERYEKKYINVYLDFYSGYKFKTADGTEVSYAEIVKSYLEMNNIPDVKINSSLTESNKNTFNDLYLEFSDSLSRDEKMAISEKIFNETGAYPDISVLTSAYNNVSTEVKLFDFIDGDANDDGKLALSDAIAILQTVGNPDTYGLTAQGEYNADIAGDFDGITNLDALTVQRRLLKLE